MTPGRAKHLVKGRNAEDRARRYLERHGLTFIESNYRCPPGEIDLVMGDRSTTVFVEVRYRENQRYGGALESIDSRKQGKLRAAARHYLQRRYRSTDVACRIDVILLSGDGGETDIEWISNAI
jgi:putative endonuclease